jgi:hypothetical protein
MADPERLTRTAVQRRAVPRAVVGHDALDADAALGEPRDGALQEGGDVSLRSSPRTST